MAGALLRFRWDSRNPYHASAGTADRLEPYRTCPGQPDSQSPTALTCLEPYHTFLARTLP